MVKKKIPFYKMHALGNDFVMLDLIRNPLQLTAEGVRQLADRHFGIGFDQLLTCEPPYDFDSDFFMRVYNADGKEAEQCGNGARCFYHYVRTIGLTVKKTIMIQTMGRTISLEAITELSSRQLRSVRGASLGRQIIVRAGMGEPDFSWNKVFKISKAKDQKKAAQIQSCDLGADGSFECGDLTAEVFREQSHAKITAYPISFGNPHLVVIIRQLSNIKQKLTEIGEIFTQHSSLLNSANINFLICNNKNRMQLRTYERGAGMTLACGSGACASFAVARQLGLAAKQITMQMTGGTAKLREENQSIFMESPVHTVFSGATDIL